MWLASVALRDSAGEIIGNATWTPEMWRYAEMTLTSTVLGGVGDRRRERLFRMNITLCLHRGVTPQELRRLPAWWHEADAVNLAGGPIEVLWSRGLPRTLSAEPCDNPTHRTLPPNGRQPRPDLWVPEDCGRCPSCVARIAAQAAPGCALQPRQEIANHRSARGQRTWRAGDART